MPDRQSVIWRRRLERRRRIVDHTITLPGASRPYTIAIPENPDAVLDELDAPGVDLCHMPYWATLWPSGLALAEVVLAQPRMVRDRHVVELGCGLGVTAAAALDAGARLAIADCFPEALAFAQYNARRNTGRTPAVRLADWRTAEGQSLLARDAPYDIVLAADVLYEPEDVSPLLELVDRLLSPGGALWLAEPGRATSERFLADARSGGWQGTATVYERDWPARAGPAQVRVHRLGKAPATTPVGTARRPASSGTV
jgi:predicted nicotinamide N-methyase